LVNVRFAPESRRDSHRLARPLRAKNGLLHCKKFEEKKPY
jgi:hypothetical protein